MLDIIETKQAVKAKIVSIRPWMDGGPITLEMLLSVIGVVNPDILTASKLDCHDGETLVKDEFIELISRWSFGHELLTQNLDTLRLIARILKIEV